VATELSPAITRAQNGLFVTHCSLAGLADRLPLRWPAPPDLPPSPKRVYRSQYTYLGWADLRDPAVWAQLLPFDLALRLVDFNPLRPVLARRLGWTSPGAGRSSTRCPSSCCTGGKSPTAGIAANSSNFWPAHAWPTIAGGWALSPASTPPRAGCATG
jgi:hypothetical protein